MNEHEQFGRHLRSLADPVPAIAVDPDAILRSGRRRRVLRAGGTTVVTVLAVGGLAVGVVALPGGSTPEGDQTVVPAGTTVPTDPAPAASPEIPPVVVDHATGTVTLPLDELTRSARDEAVIQAAAELVTATCMAEAGFGEYWEFAGVVMPTGPEDHGIDSPYGVWLADEVREHGYEGTRSALDSPRRGLPLDAPAREALEGCHRAPLEAGLFSDQSVADEWDAVAPRGVTPTGYTEEARAIVEEWAACLRENDVDPPAQDGDRIPVGVPEGALGAPFEEQVRIGLIDVACKDRVDLVRRLAEIDAAEETAYLERGGREYLEERGAVEQAQLQVAEDVLADAGVILPEG
ncbi:hypothetical protein J4G33_06575 [Actinotalea sp. BY-33]|uniref:Uncharacterized protein n=1 Tax=Actinotalea soli TaxID=2819234 RepID=A0A939RVT2_9CELL|nr:hypothetical protein [Actinotalea soli]MBO1751466.1 hypothetical protein [Actinotalea soli]